MPDTWDKYVPVLAENLKPGDTFTHWIYRSDGSGEKGIDVEIMSGPLPVDPSEDFFGREGHFKFWARRDDTGQEAWMKFGPGGRVYTRSDGAS